MQPKLTPEQVEILIDETRRMGEMDSGTLRAHINNIRETLTTGQADPNHVEALKQAMLTGEGILLARQGIDPNGIPAVGFEQSLQERVPEVREQIRTAWRDTLGEEAANTLADQFDEGIAGIDKAVTEQEARDRRTMAEAAAKLSQDMQRREEEQRAAEAALQQAREMEESKARGE